MPDIFFEVSVFAPSLAKAEAVAAERFLDATQLSPNRAKWRVWIEEYEGVWAYHFTAEA